MWFGAYFPLLILSPFTHYSSAEVSRIKNALLILFGLRNAHFGWVIHVNVSIFQFFSKKFSEKSLKSLTFV